MADYRSTDQQWVPHLYGESGDWGDLHNQGTGGGFSKLTGPLK
jgi:hypothetical protein